MIEKCISHCRKLLEIKDLTLEKLRQTVQAMEYADKQAQVMEGKDSQQLTEKSDLISESRIEISTRINMRLTKYAMHV